MTIQNRVLVDPLWKAIWLKMGVDPNEVLKKAGLSLDLFEQNSAYISTAEYFSLWHVLEELTGDPALSLNIVRSLSAEVFVPTVYAALCSTNFFFAVERIIAYKRLLGPLDIRVETTPDSMVVSVDTLQPEDPLPHALGIFDLVFHTFLARIGTRQEITPLEVTTVKKLDVLEEYAEFFGITPVLGDRYSITFSHADASLPFLTANDAVANALDAELRKRLIALETDNTFAYKVRNTLLEALPSGKHSVDEVGKRIGVSRRTLQRRLTEEGTSFQVELRSVREGLAVHYLTKTELPGVEISFLLGFNDPNSFYRAFSQWTGQSPEQYRISL